MKIAFLFPGYGSQYVGMAKELYDEHRILQEYFDEASHCLDINFIKLCFASSEIDIDRMSNAYPAMFLVSSALVALLKQEGIEPSIVAGYDQGLYTAIFAAQGITFPDGLYLLSKFAAFYQDALEKMQVSAIKISGVDTEMVENICYRSSLGGAKAFVAVYDSPTVHIIAGDNDAVEHVRDLASALSDRQKVDVDYVSVDIGLHSPLMESVENQFKLYLEKVDFKDLTVPLVEASQGHVMQLGSEIREQVITYIHTPVVWTCVMKSLADADVMVQVGPGTKLATLAQEYYPDKKIFSINKQDDINALKEFLAQPKE
jgi:(acyl-carrier-protein) S-malonyltransferase